MRLSATSGGTVFRMLCRTTSFALTLAALSTPLYRPAYASCPDPSEIEARIAPLDLDAGFRGTVLGLALDRRLLERAVSNVGRVASSREGKTVHAMLVADVSADYLWRAIGDENHFTLAERMPLDGSSVVARDGATRVVYQHARAMGTGRWWVSEVRVDGELHERTKGAMWEAHWRDPDVDPALTGFDDEKVSKRLPRLVESTGAWLVVPLADECVLLDYTVRTAPGGLMGLAQWLVARRAVKNAALGITELARAHVSECEEASRAAHPSGRPAEREPPEETTPGP